MGREALKTSWAQLLPLLQTEDREKVSLVRNLILGAALPEAGGVKAYRGRGL